VTTKALNKRSIFSSVGYKPHRGQSKIHNGRARHKASACGRRFGKSTIGGHELTVEALLTYTQKHWLQDQQKRREFWIVGPEYTDSEKEFRVLWNDLKRLKVPLDKPGSYNNPQSGEMMISLWDGTFVVHAKSAKYPGTLVGEGLSGVIMAEAAKIKRLVWTKYIRPTLADVRGWSLFNSTPEGKNWFYDLWRAGQDPSRGDWESWRMPSWENDVVFPLGKDDPEIIDMAADMSTEKFKQEIAAEFTEFVGRVFKDFDEETHVIDTVYNPQWPLYAACDYGWTNPFVWILIQIDAFDNVYVLDEYRIDHRDTNDIARDLQSWHGGLSRKIRYFYPDPASPGDTAILEKALGVNAISDTGGELKHRLERIRQKLKMGPEHAPIEQQNPRLWIDRKCIHGIKEMLDYRYPETKDEESKELPEEPLKKDDHFPEALGRFFRGHYGAPASDDRAKITKARIAA
jgi:hypothetical protein